MRPPEEAKAKLVRQWIDKAEADLRAAQTLFANEPSLTSPVGFHAQQASEKYLKAFLVEHQVDFPKTHDLDKLKKLVAKVDRSLAESLPDLYDLTDYGVDVRYPGDLPELSLEDAHDAVDLAGEVRDAILKALKK